MKKIMAMLLAGLLVCASLSGCGERKKVDLSAAKSLADLKGAIIGAQTGTFHLQALDQVDGIEKKDYGDFTDLLNALKSGAIDGYVAEEPTAYSICGQDSEFTYIPLKNNTTGFKATEEETGIAVAFKRGSEYVAQVNTIISGITQETRQSLMEQMAVIGSDLSKNHTYDNVLSSTKTDTSNGTLKIAMECAYQPFNWTQTDDSNGAVPIQGQQNMYANGYDVQIAKYVAAELGMNLEIYSYVWDSLIPAVQSGAVDGIIAGMSPTTERKAEVDFTDCYYNSNLVIIIKKK